MTSPRTRTASVAASFHRHPYVVCSLVLLSIVRKAYGILPTAGIDIQPELGEPYSFLVSQASFGDYPPMAAVGGMSPDDKDDVHVLTVPPADNPFLCSNVTSSSPQSLAMNYENRVILTPRGVCTFETKAMNAQYLLGAAGIIIYGTLESRYTINETSQEIAFPKKSSDYECNHGIAKIPAAALSFDPKPYNAPQNDPILSGEHSGNICLTNSPDNLENCPSKSCLLTGDTEVDPGTQEPLMVACCAWDLHVWLYHDSSLPEDLSVTIPSFYATMEQGQTLLRDVGNSKQVLVKMYQRYRPSTNFSVILIWAMGVFVCAVASYMSADDYRKATTHILSKRSTNGNDMGNTNGSGDIRQNNDGRARSRSPSSRTNGNNGNNDLDRLEAMPSSYQTQDSAESLELGAEHACGFIIMASSGLLILFFFKIYNFVKFMYAFGCSGAVTQILAYPLVTKVMGNILKIQDRIVFRTKVMDIGHIYLYEMMALILGYGVGMIWLIVAFVARNPEEFTFYWVTQDVLGACMCIMFLSIIKLNSIRVASILLIVAFFYDIFFVFVTPLIFNGDSVMITVATSGGPPKADPSWCEKYPDDEDCQGGNPLPMLLTVPRIGDYQGGASLLGLGDIVLPGLLLSFAARLDAAKHLVGLMGGGSGTLHSNTCPTDSMMGGKLCCRGLCNGGYFFPLVIAYGIGLSMANAAVYLMNMGQPALLYLVPCCLGTMAYMGYQRNELQMLWDGPKTIRAADNLVYGEEGPPNDGRHVPLATSEHGGYQNTPSTVEVEATPVPSAVDDPINNR